MEVVPISVGAASRAWDEQHLELDAAGHQVSGADTGGFTPAVGGAATRFTSAWSRFVGAAADECEDRADGLRTAIRDYVTSDGQVGSDLLLLRTYLQERR